MLKLSDRTTSSSCIDFINAKVMELQKQGRKIINLYRES
jgi:hypothetical protein